jgi:phage regulator Rha-like protein
MELVQIKNGKPVTDSREIAKAFGKKKTNNLKVRFVDLMLQKQTIQKEMHIIQTILKNS